MEGDKLEERKRELANKLSKLFSEGGSVGEVDKDITPAIALEERKKKIFDFIFKKDSNWLYFLLLLPVLWLGWFIRTRNVPLLQGKYLLGLDPYFFYRYAQTIFEQGALPVIDYMRYSPVGYPTKIFSFFSYTLVYLYKFFHFFNPSMSQIDWHIIYPPVVTIISFVIFFLFVREIFNNKVALVSTAFLAVIPAYIYRTGAGFADHEAMAMLWMFLSLYFFVLMWKSDNWKKAIPFGSLSGIFAGAMAATWGGSQILTVSIAIFVLSATLIVETKKQNFIGYSTWYIFYGLFAGMFHTLKPSSTFFIAFDGLVLLFALLILGAVIFTKKYKDKFSKFTKFIPPPVLVILVVGSVLAIAAILTGLLDLQFVYSGLTRMGISRFETTVSESQQPYFLGGSGWWGSFRWSFILMFLGSVFLSFKLFEGSKKIALALSSSFGVALFFFILGRYKPAPSAVIQFFSKTYLLWFFGFVALIIAAYIYLYNRDRDKFESVFSTKWQYLLIFSWFLIAILMSRTQLRLMFALAPVAAIIIGYFAVEFSRILTKRKLTKILAVVLILFTIFAFYSSASMAYAANRSSGSGYPGQWESAMTWISENTPKDAVIAHWWDYGYWTQTMGKRTSVGDGGNLMGWNHGLGRYIMTSTELDKTLEYSKTHKVTHLLYSEEEIPKYHAFSLIGSDENLDRLSTIGTFGLQSQQEVRDGTRLIYQGTWPFDKDYIIGNRVLPEGQAFIIGFSYILKENSITEPKTYIFYKGQQLDLDTECIYLQGERLEFGVNKSLGGCFTIIPAYQNNGQVIASGAALWTSEKVKDGLFAKLYINSEEIPYFKEVYADNTPLALYQGRVIGPIKIWEIEYPDGIKTDDKYLELSPYG